MYQLGSEMFGKRIIIRISDGARIPPDERNIDYQEFLAWVAEGNAPLPPDEPPAETQ